MIAQSAEAGDDLTQEFEALARKFGRRKRQAGDIAARPRQGSDQASANRVPRRREDDRNDRCRLLCRDDCCGPRCDDDTDLEPDELGRDFGEALAASICPAILDRDGATFEPAEFAQSLHKCGGPFALDGRRERAQEPDSRQLRRLLRARTPHLDREQQAGTTD
jgi:glycine/D-amino acid oxidase-like deaminating enzyme